ncbi:MAG: hypothetical protein HY828_03940 [Actinobacteria bacterium]|nr:hypothetical protein [Actinomycetota bacterium]
MAERVAGQQVRYGQIDRDYAMKMLTMAPEDDGPIWMVNLMKYREKADYADGRESDITGKEADDRYAPLGPLKAIGAQPVFLADVETQFLNDTPKWDRVGIVKYPSRKAFLEMQQRPDFKELHHHKEAGMAETIVCGCLPMPLPELPADAPSWDEVPHPPTEDDGYVVVIHVIKFKDENSRGEMATYSDHAGKVAVPNGVRLAAWTEVEGTILGDGRQWDQIRFNVFPSRAAFMAVVFDPDRLEAQKAHRETAIADTYTLITRPSIDRLYTSITGEPSTYPSRP